MAADSKSLHPIWVLLLDDEPLFRHALGRLLRSRGCTVTEAGDGEEGLRILAKSQEFDVVLTDLEMPKMGGLEALRHTRKLGIGLPFVVMSGRANESRKHEVEALGAWFLEKPFRTEVLVEFLWRAKVMTRPER